MNLVCSLLGCSSCFRYAYISFYGIACTFKVYISVSICIIYFAIQSAFILKLVSVATQRSSSSILTALCVWVPLHIVCVWVPLVSICFQSFHKRKSEAGKYPCSHFLVHTRIQVSLEQCFPVEI